MLNLILPLGLALNTAAAADPGPPAPPPPPPPKAFELSGQYAIWGLSQHNFLLGADNPLDDADYVTQMLRVQAQAKREHYGVLARLDAAQGWWGVDNSPNTQTVVTVDADGNPVGSSAYNTDKLFGNKDTNYGVHVDLAYAWVELPGAALRASAGRMPYNLGQRLVLDQELDGVQLRFAPKGPLAVEAWWAKMSEGQGSGILPTGATMSDLDTMADADLLGGILRLAPTLSEGSSLKLEAFGMAYTDRSGTDETGRQSATLLPNGLGYADARFQPNLSQVLAFGLSGDVTLPVAQGLGLKFEGDYLVGSDDVKNTDHAGGLLDQNNGELSGWNAWVDATQHFAAGVPMRVALGLGMGSGDDDVTSGKGNINRIQTMGFWHLTNVWEDSVMPDIAGISPQGLGSPVSRGYRELENTTMAQLRAGLKPHDKVDVEASYTFLKATQPITGWDATGAPVQKRSDAIGQEVDLNVGISIWKGISYQVQSGIFLPGQGAGLLINGNTDSLESAWEIKQVAVAVF